MSERKTRRKQKKTNHSGEGTFARVFIIVLVFLILLNIFVPNPDDVSSPHLTWESWISGDFMDQFEAYESDSFAGKSIWRSLKVALDRIGGDREENGVVLGKGHQLFERIVSPDQDDLNEDLSAISQFAEDNPKLDLYMMVVPDAANVLEDSLPAMVTMTDQTRLITQVKRTLEEQVNWIDVSNVLSDHADEDIYYLTDHRWTSLGAFYAFEEAAEVMELDDADLSSSYASYCVSDHFTGDLSAISGLETRVREEIDIYVKPSEDDEVIVNYVDDQKRSTSLYDLSQLETDDPYRFFLGGDTSLIDIKTVSDSSRRLLLIKDSFANCFIPFLTPYYREIVVVDPQAYSGTIDEILADYHVTDVLFLYSGNTLFQDSAISEVFESEQQE